MNLATFVLCVLLVAGVFWTGCLLGYRAGVESMKRRFQQLLGAWAADNRHERIVVKWREDET